MNLIPTIIEKNDMGERAYDIYSRLLKDRIIILNGEINDNTANVVVAEFLYLDSLNSDDICLYINSPGGSITAGMAIYDTMQYIKPDVATICLGQAASMGSLLLAAGAPGKRSALPNSRIMIHQPSGGFQGQASDIAIHAKETLRVKARLNEIYAFHTGKPVDKIENDMERDNFMSAVEAVEYGLIDKVIERTEK